jgi:hypothetical protein
VLEPELPVLPELPELPELPVPELELPLEPLPSLPVEATKGFASDAMVAAVKSKSQVEVSSCCEIPAFLSVVASELPDFHAAMNPALELLRLMLPPLQLWQLEHTTLAVMVSPLTPEPARSVSFAAVLLVSSEGSTWFVPALGEIVTLPDPS